MTDKLQEMKKMADEKLEAVKDEVNSRRNSKRSFKPKSTRRASWSKKISADLTDIFRSEFSLNLAR